MSNKTHNGKKRKVLSVPVTGTFGRVRRLLKREAVGRGLSEADVAREKIAQAYETDEGKAVAA